MREIAIEDYSILVDMRRIFVRRGICRHIVASS